MNIVNFLIPIALAMGAAFVVAFVVATRRGQYDDLETPAHRMLIEDMPEKKKDF